MTSRLLNGSLASQTHYCFLSIIKIIIMGLESVSASEDVIGDLKYRLVPQFNLPYHDLFSFKTLKNITLFVFNVKMCSTEYIFFHKLNTDLFSFYSTDVKPYLNQKIKPNG